MRMPELSYKKRSNKNPGLLSAWLIEFNIFTIGKSYTCFSKIERHCLC